MNMANKQTPGSSNANVNTDRPGPPVLPKDWAAVWNDDLSRYYYWHKPTRKVQWKIPEPEVVEEGPDTSGRDEAGRSGASAEWEDEEKDRKREQSGVVNQPFATAAAKATAIGSTSPFLASPPMGSNKKRPEASPKAGKVAGFGSQIFKV